MTVRTAKWFVRRESDSRILCTDGLWRHNAGCIESIKWYSSSGRALRYGLKNYDHRIGCGGTAYGVYSDDRVDCLGNITRGSW